MTTSLTGPAWTSDPSQLSRKQVGYYRARFRNRVHQLVLEQYLKLEATLTRAELARRLYKRPEVITRLLGAPGNWTLDTVSDLLLGMGYEPKLGISDLSNHQAANPIDEDLQLPNLRPEEAKKEETIFLANRPTKDDEIAIMLAPYKRGIKIDVSNPRAFG